MSNRRLSRFAAALGVFVAVCATPACARRVVEYRGICDASAAVALSGDRFVVADDEQDWLSIYRIGQPKALGTVPLGEFFAHKKGEGKEADIEGAARIGDRIYWISSHGRNSEGELKASRLRFFATRVIGEGEAATVEPPAKAPYAGLLQALVADPRFEPLARADAAGLPPKAAGGLNIEGLAATPEGGLLIGFRNPLPAGKAMLVPLLNPAAVVEGAAQPQFGDAVLLDLGRRGVRSIEWIRGRYVIAAGPFGAEGGGGPGSDFELFTWSGRSGEAAVPVTTVALDDLKPEALFEILGTSRVHVLSDDGAACKQGKVSAKKRRFRAVTVELR